MSALKRSVEVDADSIASDPRVLVRQHEHKRGIVAKADPALAYTQAALWLAEEYHIWREWEVLMVLQGVATKELWGLCHTVTTWLPKKQKSISLT